LKFDRPIIAVGRQGLPANGEIVDLCDVSSTLKLLDRTKPSIIVHAAALANVDRCEQEPTEAWLTNVEATRHLAGWAARQVDHVHFVYISTDQIYNGPGPSSEDQPRPCNVYSLTKMWAEDLVRILPKGLVLRVNFLGLGFAGRNSLVDWLIGSLRSGKPITLFRDALFNPLYAGDLVKVIAVAIGQDLVGTFNCAASDAGLSKAELGKYVATALGLSTSAVTIGSVKDVKLSARRPCDTRMMSGRLGEALEIELPQTETTLSHLVDEIRQQAVRMRQQ
jgi:dTDP-4-dehydrorhamnose reductase